MKKDNYAKMHFQFCNKNDDADNHESENDRIQCYFLFRS